MKDLPGNKGSSSIFGIKNCLAGNALNDFGEDNRCPLVPVSLKGPLFLWYDITILCYNILGCSKSSNNRRDTGEGFEEPKRN